MAKVVPTILSTDSDDYSARIDRVKGFADRIHIDLSDGVFTETRTIGPAQVYGPEGVLLDMHLMLNRAASNIETIISLSPHLVILHFEGNDDLGLIFDQLKACDIKVGLAIKPGTKVMQVADLVPRLDHVLIFTNSHIGRNSLATDDDFAILELEKIAELKAIKADIEVAVDGGINQRTASLAIEAGADILNVGSFIQDADDPEVAYEALRAIAEGEI